MSKLKVSKLLKIVIPTLMLGACTPKTEPSTPVEPPKISYVADFEAVKGDAINAKNYTLTETNGNNVLKTEIDKNNSKVGDKYYTYGQTNREIWNQDGTWFYQETTYANPLTTYNTFFAGLSDVADAEDGLLTMQDSNGNIWTGSVNKASKTFEIESNGKKLAVSKIGTTNVNVPEATLYVEKTPADIWRETKALALEKGNFTFKTYENGTLKEEMYVDNDNAKVGETYYVPGFEINNEDGTWYGIATEQTTPKQKVITWLNNLTLDGQTIYEVDGEQYLLVKDFNIGERCYTSADGTSLMVLKDGRVWELSDIDNTVVEVPQWQEKQNQEVTELVREDGSYNIKLMKSCVLDWLQGNNVHGKDYLAYKMRYDSYQTQGLVFVNPTDEKLQLGIFYATPEELPQLRFLLAEVDNANLDYSNKEAFVDSLYNFARSGFEYILQIDGMYSDANTLKQANLVLSKLGEETSAVLAYETDILTSGLMGSTYDMICMTQEGEFYVTRVLADSKEAALNGEFSCEVKQMIETSPENVEQQEAEKVEVKEFGK